MPTVPFSIPVISKIKPPRLVSWSHQQGTTRAGSTEVTTILHLDGWHDKESVPASILKVLSMLITSKRKWNFCRIKVDSSIILNKWFSSCWSLTSMSRSKWEGHTLGKTWNTRQNNEKTSVSVKHHSPIARIFSAWKIIYCFGKIFWLKIRLDVDKRSISVDVSVYWTTFFKTY